MEITLECVEVRVADATTMPLHVARPAASENAVAGILVLQDAFGYNSCLQSIARRCCELGLTAVIPELYHRTGIGIGAEYDNPLSYEANRPHMRALTAQNMVNDVKAAHAWLVTENAIPPERVAAIGWCLGGRLAFLANAYLPLGAAISMYGGGIAPNLLHHAKTQHGRILMIWAGADKFLPPEERIAVSEALTEAQKPHDDVVFSDAQHGFFSPYAYHELAAGVSWSMTIEYLRATGVIVGR
jgi:carboxymethylenebutenolidase